MKLCTLQWIINIINLSSQVQQLNIQVAKTRSSLFYHPALYRFNLSPGDHVSLPTHIFTDVGM